MPKQENHHRKQDRQLPSSAAYAKTREQYTHYRKSLPKPNAENLDLQPIIRKHYSFIDDSSSSAAEGDKREEWERRVTQKYSDKLYKEYALCQFGNGQIAMRWRTEREVLKGKGESICGNLECKSTRDLRECETVFSFKERGVAKDALVKLSLCPQCMDRMLELRPPREVPKVAIPSNEVEQEVEVKEVVDEAEENPWLQDNQKLNPEDATVREYDDFFNKHM